MSQKCAKAEPQRTWSRPLRLADNEPETQQAASLQGATLFRLQLLSDAPHFDERQRCRYRNQTAEHNEHNGVHLCGLPIRVAHRQNQVIRTGDAGTERFNGCIIRIFGAFSSSLTWFLRVLAVPNVLLQLLCSSIPEY